MIMEIDEKPEPERGLVKPRPKTAAPPTKPATMRDQSTQKSVEEFEYPAEPLNPTSNVVR
jgi:hypothetical protein